MHRFYIPTESIRDGKVNFSIEQTHQINNVLRLKPGENVLVFDNTGWQYEIELFYPKI